MPPLSALCGVYRCFYSSHPDLVLCALPLERDLATEVHELISVQKTEFVRFVLLFYILPV